MGMHNKGTYTRVLTYAYTRIDIRVYAYRHTRIRKIRAYNTRMRSSDISELHCNACFDWLKQHALSENRARLMPLLLLWKIKIQRMRREISGLFVIKQIKNLGSGAQDVWKNTRLHTVFSPTLLLCSTASCVSYNRAEHSRGFFTC